MGTRLSHQRDGSARPPVPDELISELYRAHGLALVRVALLLVGDRPSAEDVVQEAFFGLHRALPRLRDTDKALPYLRAAPVPVGAARAQAAGAAPHPARAAGMVRGTGRDRRRGPA
jgi:hypothetical protein